ncbi:MAG: nickel-dependent lactate racemase [Acidobacteriota bacterium]
MSMAARRRIRLAYGRSGLEVELPAERTVVVEPRLLPGLPDETAALREALRKPLAGPPLAERIRRSHRVAVAICDVTRPMPTARVLPVLLSELGIPERQVVILVATGTHRASTPAELESMVGPEVLSRYRVVDHDSRDPSQLVSLGRTASGIPILLHREWVEADVRITTGFVEPHFFAGFSGGPKLVAPGLAGLETVMELHSARLIGDPFSTWGEIDTNPIHREIREIAGLCGVHFALDVTINRQRRITGVFAGDLAVSHPAACQAARRAAMQPVDREFEVVVTTNSGYPLDLNLYQSVKGMSAAARVVCPGGDIICAAECSDGIPEHGSYGRLLASAAGPEALLELIHRPGFQCPDQWQVQIQAQIQRRARVHLYTGGLTVDQIRAAHLEPVEDIGALVEARLAEIGPSARVCVLPEGPQTIPYLA